MHLPLSVGLSAFTSYFSSGLLYNACQLFPERRASIKDQGLFYNLKVLILATGLS